MIPDATWKIDYSACLAVHSERLTALTSTLCQYLLLLRAEWLGIRDLIFLINSQAQYFGWFKYCTVPVFCTELAEVCWACRFLPVSLAHCLLRDDTPRLFHWCAVCPQLGSDYLSSENGLNRLVRRSFAEPLKYAFAQPYSSLSSLKKIFPKLNVNIQLAGGTHGTCSVAWKITFKISRSAL